MTVALPADMETTVAVTDHDRFARLVGGAVATFGDRKKALLWLHRPTSSLGGRAPIELAGTDAGCREVETALGRIAHGLAT